MIYLAVAWAFLMIGAVGLHLNKRVNHLKTILIETIDSVRLLQQQARARARREALLEAAMQGPPRGLGHFSIKVDDGPPH